MNWFSGWSEIKKPTASNSFDNLSSNFQSSIKFTISSSLISSEPNKSIWFATLLSKIFFDFKIKLGIELNKACLLALRLSKAPALTNPSNWSLFISLGFTLLIKSLIDINLPFWVLSIIMFDTA